MLLMHGGVDTPAVAPSLEDQTSPRNPDALLHLQLLRPKETKI